MRSKLIVVSVFQPLGIRERERQTVQKRWIEREREKELQERGRDRKRQKRIGPNSLLHICFKIRSREFRSTWRQWSIKSLSTFTIFTRQQKYKTDKCY